MASVLEIGLMVALALLPVVVFGEIFRKAGYSGWLGLLMLIPVVNVVWLLIFAFGDWPIRRELSRSRMGPAVVRADDVEIRISEAVRLERKGQWDEALLIYDELAAEPENSNADYAAHCARRLRERMDASPGE